MTTEVEKREDILSAMERYRADAVKLGRAAADAIYRERGEVSAPLVFARLRAEGHGHILDAIDGRFMGAVFRRGWVRTGWSPTGSHCRPVATWRKAGAQWK